MGINVLSQMEGTHTFQAGTQYKALEDEHTPHYLTSKYRGSTPRSGQTWRGVKISSSASKTRKLCVIGSPVSNTYCLMHIYSPSWSVCSSADNHLLKIPLFRCKTKGDLAFSFFGPSVWNSRLLHIRNAKTTDTFKSALKTYLFNLQESD